MDSVPTRDHYHRKACVLQLKKPIIKHRAGGHACEAGLQNDAHEKTGSTEGFASAHCRFSRVSPVKLCFPDGAYSPE